LQNPVERLLRYKIAEILSDTVFVLQVISSTKTQIYI